MTEGSVVKINVMALEVEMSVPGRVEPEFRSSTGEVEEGPSSTEK